MRPAPALMALSLALGLARPHGAHAGWSPDAGIRQARLAANELALHISNQGSLGWDLTTGQGGIGYPRVDGRHLMYASGLWIGGQVSGAPRLAIAEFRLEFVPGAIEAGTWSRDTTRFRVFRASRHDTTGWADWVHVAGPLGAPLDAAGTAPSFPGDQAVWTVFNDAASAPSTADVGRTTPIGVEVQQLAYAFHRRGALDRAVFLRHRLIHKGSATLDSTYVGLFQDHTADDTPRSYAAASDTARDMAYSYRHRDDDWYGASGPAIGLRLLRGPWDDARAQRLRLSSNVIWANGDDPSDAIERDRVLRGLRRNGTAMFDSSAMAPTRFHASGDPVSGAGWNPTRISHPHGVLAAGPFMFAPGDTQDIEFVIVVGQGETRLGSVTDLRLASDTLRTLLEEDFASAPPYVPYPPDPPDPPPPPVFSGRAVVHPNPFTDRSQLRFAVASTGERVRVDVLDLAGRRVRRLLDDVRAAGEGAVEWDGRDASGQRLPAGLYFARVRLGSRTETLRWVRID